MSESDKHKIIILAAPSGAGKTSIKSRLLAAMPNQLSFSVSAATRKIRAGEKHGVDYFFISEEEFKNKIDNNQFIEWEMVYPGSYYGTTVDEMQRIWGENKTPILDIDVQGALHVKELYGDRALAIFIKPPSLAILQERLEKRGTDNADQIKTRIAKAAEEISFSNNFDHIVLNDDLNKASEEVKQQVTAFIA
ncbi:MAG: guanylate kinase [Chitinophagaceae bacterium]